MCTHLHPFAKVNHRRNGRTFGVLCGDDRRRHVYLLGKTGSGKSALMQNLIASDLREGHGVAVLDPHGDLADASLALVPSSRSNDLILLDPSDHDFPVSLNVLEHVESSARPLVVSGVIGVFRKVFPDFWGPRLEHLFRNCLLALLESPGSTLLGVVRMLTDERFRDRIVRQVKDPLVKFFWTREFTLYSKAFAAEVVSPVQNKLGAFLTSPLVRNLVGQARTSVSFRDVMDEGRILIANLSKGKLGDDASSLFGSLLMTKFQLAAMERANVPETERRDFYLHIDEFPNFMTESFAGLLSEASVSTTSPRT